LRRIESKHSLHKFSRYTFLFGTVRAVGALDAAFCGRSAHEQTVLTHIRDDRGESG
jgi:hypothetical protein